MHGDKMEQSILFIKIKVYKHKENRVIVRRVEANVHVVGLMAQLETVNDMHIE